MLGQKLEKNDRCFFRKFMTTRFSFEDSWPLMSSEFFQHSSRISIEISFGILVENQLTSSKFDYKHFIILNQNSWRIPWSSVFFLQEYLRNSDDKYLLIIINFFCWQKKGLENISGIYSSEFRPEKQPTLLLNFAWK